MKKTLLMLLVSAFIILPAAGCATAPRDAGDSVAELRTPVLYDLERITIINETAKRRGVEVIWLNPPERRQPVADNGPQ
jgi:hypothetical protein